MSTAYSKQRTRNNDDDLDPNRDPDDKYFGGRSFEPGAGNESSSCSESESESEDEAHEIPELSSSRATSQQPTSITFPKSPPNEFPYLRSPPHSELAQLHRRPAAPTSSDNRSSDGGHLRPEATPRRKSNSSNKSRRSSHSSEIHRSGTVFATQQASNGRRIQHDTRSCPTRDCKECSGILYQNCRIRDLNLRQRDKSQGIRLPNRPEGTAYDLQPAAW